MAANIRRDSPQRNSTRAGKILGAAILCAGFAFSSAEPAMGQEATPKEFVFSDEGFAVTSAWKPEREAPDLTGSSHAYKISVDFPVHVTCIITVIRLAPDDRSDDELLQHSLIDHPDATKVLQGIVVGGEFATKDQNFAWITREFAKNHVLYSIFVLYDVNWNPTKKGRGPGVPPQADAWLNSFRLLDARAPK